MPYHIETWDHPQMSARRSELRDRHIAYLESQATRLLACGPKLNDDGTSAGGGIYIVDIDDREQARRFIEADPYCIGGLFRDIVMTQWRKAFLDGRSFLRPPG
ncbi:YciI family protein [Verticiella sediminum]|uniref:YciI family protein n=1 Tax=Verticiella sediminum TaxID=1247510 RepID=A0A556AJ27_9BURK|nr:YciI family protein [Verticiella sediminum]TSH92876.1 YciI family protein [Verticiella sediminum]